MTVHEARTRVARRNAAVFMAHNLRGDVANDYHLCKNNAQSDVV
jgi:hypothetical protein